MDSSYTHVGLIKIAHIKYVVVKPYWLTMLLVVPDMDGVMEESTIFLHTEDECIKHLCRHNGQ